MTGRILQAVVRFCCARPALTVVVALAAAAAGVGYAAYSLTLETSKFHLLPLHQRYATLYKEYAEDLGHPLPSNGDLTPWSERGVLLLNRALTVQPGKANSHQGKGWEAVTEQAIKALAARDAPLVSILWGRNARNLRPLLEPLPAIESAHPSPLSAHAGFFGSKPFSRANELLEKQGAEPIDWKLP